MIRELEAKISKNGFTYVQAYKKDKSFIYAQYNDEKDEHPIAWEVFKRRVVNPHPKDLNQNKKVAFPGNEDFGKWAWTYKNFKDALRQAHIIEADKCRDQ